MCTILFQYKMNDKYPFIYLGNRDEFKSRPTRLGTIEEGLLMGKDLEAGGSWMAVRDNGRIAFITNYRDMTDQSHYVTSRGELVLRWVQGDMNIPSFTQELIEKRHLYKGYNLVYGKVDQLHYYCNVHNCAQEVQPGIHGLSNGCLDESWHKVVQGKGDLVSFNPLLEEQAFHILSKPEVYRDNLPQTGLSKEDEIALSAIFVDLDQYGTVVQQYIRFDGKQIQYYEKSIQDNFNSKRHLTLNMR